MDTAKSLLPVKGRDTFLDFIARQILHLRDRTEMGRPSFYLMDSFSTQKDSLAYLTIDRLLEATGAVNAGFCSACLTGHYPVDVPVDLRKDILEDNDMPPSGLERLIHEP